MTGRMPASSRALDTCWQHGGRALLSPVAGGKLRTAPGGLPRAVGPAEARPGSESWQFRSVSNVHLPLTPGRQADSSLTATTCRPFCFRAVGVLGPEDVTGESDPPVTEGRAVVVVVWPGLGRLSCGSLPPLTAACPPGRLCKGPTRPAALEPWRAPFTLYGSPSTHTRAHRCVPTSSFAAGVHARENPAL